MYFIIIIIPFLFGYC